MSNVRFLDQVAVSAFATSGSGGGGDLGVYADGVLILKPTANLNFSGSGFDVVATSGDTVRIESIAQDPFPYTGSAIISGSLEVIGFENLTGSLFIEASEGDPLVVSVRDGNGDDEKVKVNNDGLLVLADLETTPTAVSGALMYSSSNFWLGIE